MRDLDPDLAETLASLLPGDIADAAAAEQKYDTIESIASQVITLLQEQNVTKAICGDLEKHAYSVNDSIRDSTVRNLHILATV